MQTVKKQQILETSKEKEESMLLQTLKAIKERTYFEINSKQGLTKWLDKMDKELLNG